MKKRISLGVACLMVAVLFVACGRSTEGENIVEDVTAKLVNTKEEKMDGIQALDIRYGTEKITIKKSDNDNIQIKEYMKKDDESYHAQIENTAGSLSVKVGQRPSENLDSYVEIHIPEGYNGDLKVMTESGRIESEMDLTLKEVDIQSTSGEIELKNVDGEKMMLKTADKARVRGDKLMAKDNELSIETATGDIEFKELEAKTIMLKSTSGKIKVDMATGEITAESDSGEVEIKKITGSGEFKSDAKIQAEFEEVSGDVMAEGKDKDVIVTVKEDASFKFEATTQSGEIKTYFDKEAGEDEKNIQQDVGDNAEHTIKMTSDSGKLEIKK